jgi:hypothetical protein
MRLGKYMKLQATRSKTDPYFIIQEEHHSEGAQKLPIAHDVIERMIRERQFTMRAASVKLSSRLAVNEIFLCIQSDQVYRISRFPRSLLQDDEFAGTSFTCSTTSFPALIAKLSLRHRNAANCCYELKPMGLKVLKSTSPS